MLLTGAGKDTLNVNRKGFYSDVIQGLSRSPKRLSSKYFYDQTGDQLFQAIMGSADYYLSRCEGEIFRHQATKIVDHLTVQNSDFELIELGPGNCAKSIHLLRALMAVNAAFKYIPIDISDHIIREIRTLLPAAVPGLRFDGLTGEYFDQLASHCLISKACKIVMCLGGNIGNMTMAESNQFCEALRGYLRPGDQCIIGFDLVKHPAVVRRAYDDREGLTKAFNLNLLTRINRELFADFDIGQFDHYCSYDPLSGAAKSFLVCLRDMVVHFPDTGIPLKKNECIWTEISQKYSPEQIYQMAAHNGFVHSAEFSDARSWFMDAVWTAV